MSQEKTTDEYMHVLEKERGTIKELEQQPGGARQQARMKWTGAGRGEVRQGTRVPDESDNILRKV